MKKNKKRVFIIVLLVVVALSTIFLNLKDSVPRWYSSFIFKEIKIEFDLALHETDGSQEEGWFYYDELWSSSSL